MINHVSTTTYTTGAVATVLVRGDGVNLKTSSDFGATFDSTAFSFAPSAGATANDAGIGMILPTDTVGVQAYEGEYFQVLVYNRNLTAAELATMSVFVNARTPKGTNRIWAALGDSLTEGATGAFPWPARATQALRSRNISVANKGKSGDTSTGAQARWLSDIKPYGTAVYYGVNYNIGTNDLSAGTAATTIYANIVATETDIRAQGMKCILGTVSPQNTFVGWTGAMETQRLALNTSIRGNTDCTIIDYDPIMWDPANHSNLDPAKDFGDHRHYNDVGMAAVSAAVVPVIQGL
jgi:lysophospholipase L1-like esterase